jgi:hypothetical protein
MVAWMAAAHITWDRLPHCLSLPLALFSGKADAGASNRTQSKRQNAAHARARLQMQQFEAGHLKKLFPRACAMPALRTWFFVTLFAFVLNAADFPAGTYTRCAEGAQNPSGNQFLRFAGFQNGARLTLAQSGSTVTSTYVDQDGLTQSLSFSTTTDTLATLAPRGQVIPGFKSLCVLGPGRWKGYPASMTVSAGALAYEAGMLFLTLTGDLRASAGACGALSQPGASFWVVCENRQGGTVPSADPGSAPVAKPLAGRHSCDTQIDTVDHVNGRSQYAVGGASGTLNLTVDGARVTAQYSGDPSLTGTLLFHPKTSTAAGAETGQTLMAPCVATGRPSGTAGMLRIAAASLTLLDSTPFLSFAGAMADDSPCPGAQVAGSVICSK